MLLQHMLGSLNHSFGQPLGRGKHVVRKHILVCRSAQNFSNYPLKHGPLSHTNSAGVPKRAMIFISTRLVVVREFAVFTGKTSTHLE
jgi:hypothetical protein